LSDIMRGAGNANAAGTVGATQAWQNTIPSITQGISNIYSASRNGSDPARRPIGGTFQQQLRNRYNSISGRA
jgi:hypothetical protein